MATQIKHRRGTTSEHSTFTGSEAEITVDTTKDTLIVHDGSTAGGHELAKADGSNIAFGDNVKAKFGAGDDLQIYHNGLDSYIDNTGTGSLIIQDTDGTGDIYLRPKSGQTAIGIYNDNAVEIGYAGVTKLGTTSTGIDVTGSVTATVTDNSDVLTLISTDADENSGPRLALTRNSASPADNDYVGLISFNGENSTSESIRMGMIRTQVLDVTDGSEDSTLTFYSRHDGTETQRLATTSTGIDVTGTVTSDGLTSAGNVLVSQSGANSAITINRTDESPQYNLTMGQSGSSPYITGNDAQVFHINVDPDNTQGNSAFNLNIDGNTALKADAGGDISFYDNTGSAKFFWDSSAESLGIGTSSITDARLEVSGGGIDVEDGGGTPRLRFYNGTTFQSGIEAVQNSGSMVTGSVAGDFGIRSQSNMLFAAGGSTERMRIDSSGNVLVGTTDTTPARSNDAGGMAFTAGGRLEVSQSGGPSADFNRSNDGDVVRILSAGTPVGSIASRGGTVSTLILDPRTNGCGLTGTSNAVLPTSNAGAIGDANTSLDLGANGYAFRNAYLSGGVYLGGTGAANKLDDYEEGTFTPTIIGTGSNPTVTYGTRVGKYTKVGNLVTVYVSMETTGFSGGSGNLLINDLPFTAVGNSVGGAPMFYKVDSFAEIAPYIGNGTAYVSFIGRNTTDTNTAWTALQTSAWTAANPTLARFTMTYFTT